jgi:hypothetical protein
VPLFLVQLRKELNEGGVPKTAEISGTARAHGRQLLKRGFTILATLRAYVDRRDVDAVRAAARPPLVKVHDRRGEP